MRKKKQQQTSADLGPHRWFGASIYVGGHSRLSPSPPSRLYFTTKAIGIGVVGPEVAVIPMDTVTSIDVAGGQVAKLKVGAVLAFGVLGGLAAKGSKDQTTVTVRTKDGETAYYLIDEQSPVTVRALITPILRLANVPFADELPTETSSVPDIADQIRKLAALRDEGLLTEEEFAAQKAKLLG